MGEMKTAPERKEVRRFRHVDGFQDGTKYIEINGDKSFIVGTVATEASDIFPLDKCLSFVARGDWRELPEPPEVDNG